MLLAYLHWLTGYSRQHLSRRLAQYRETHSLEPLARASRTSFVRRYGHAEVALLAEIDSLHDTLSGPATKVLLRRWGLRDNDSAAMARTPPGRKSFASVTSRCIARRTKSRMAGR